MNLFIANLLSVYSIYQVTLPGVLGIGAPSFVSGWVLLQAQNNATGKGQTTINHNLNEYPVKVDVQVKATDNGQDYVFTGIGSAHRDDDQNAYYGGVIYVYNTVHIKLYVPVTNMKYGATNKGRAAYTGGSNFQGPSGISGIYFDVYVRVRAWLLCDFGNPSFVSQWVITMDDSSNTFKSVSHNLNNYPDVVSVQVKMDDNYISDAQGNVFVGSYVDSYQALGGVVYGYDQNTIRLWSPKQEGSSFYNGAVFTIYDGWGEDERWNKDSGLIRIMMWNFPADELVFTQTLNPFGIGVNSVSYEVTFPTTYSLDSYLVTVEVSADGGNNNDYRFQGAGSCMSDSDDIYGSFGGVVYVYTTNKVLLYRPADLSGGKLVYIGDRWGDGDNSQSSNTGTVIVKVFLASSGSGACGHGTCAPDMTSLSVTCDCTSSGYIGTFCKTGANCPIPSDVNNAEKQYSSVTENSKVLYSCNSGYYLSSGSQQLTCASQSWTGTAPVCSALQCSDPGDVGNASKALSGTDTGDTVTYTCDSGNTQSSGDSIRTCGADGHWSGSPPICTAIQCLTPAAVAGASMIAEGNYYGNTVTYTCLDGYSHTSGSMQLLCQANGAWDNSFPTCTRIQCGLPESGTSATHTVSTRYKGDQVVYSCDSGTSLASGDVIRTCQVNQQWSGTAPVCTPVTAAQCSTAASAAGASVIAEGNDVGDKVTYTCLDGYSHTSGSLQLTCLANGKWDNSVPTCTRIQCGLPESGTSANSTVSTRYKDDQVVYTCTVDTTLSSGDLIRTCQADGSWSGTAPNCSPVTAAQCSTAASVAGASVIAEGNDVGHKVTYTCLDGYSHTSGSLQLTCLANGKWDNSVPTCTLIQCDLPESGTSANSTVNTLKKDDQVVYTCTADTTLSSGDLIRTCQADGSWSGTAPICLPATQCSTAASVAGASVIAEGKDVGHKVTYTCLDGYSHTSGSLQLTCLANGNWDNSVPTCTRIQCDLPESGTSANSTVSTLYKDDQVVYACTADTTLSSGDLIRTCQADGSWSGTAPICLPEVKCPAAASITGANMQAQGIYVGDIATYSCQEGYIHTSGSTTIRCLNTGAWDEAGPVCSLVTCSDPSAVANCAVNVSSKNFGGNATYTCDSGFAIVSGDSTRYCASSGVVSGYWTGTSPVCIEFTIVSTTNGLENTTLDERIVLLKKELEVPKKNTSSYRRSLISMEDDRPSALYIGSIGIVMLCVICALMIVSDTLTLWQKLKEN